MTSKFAYFNFTCGNFTKGQGYIRYDQKTLRDNQKDLESAVGDYLEEKGERKCNVIFTEMRTLDSDENARPGRINHQIDERWYSNVPHLFGMAAPVVIPHIVGMLNEKE